MKLMDVEPGKRCRELPRPGIIDQETQVYEAKLVFQILEAKQLMRGVRSIQHRMRIPTAGLTLKARSPILK
ncbi:MAG TPA: hypothetical protein VFQ83_03470 [Candidatus Udaeobacter sp.]|nr:hypothetical protein [Candidatus Udaeobacter sp.]